MYSEHIKKNSTADSTTAFDRAAAVQHGAKPPYDNNCLVLARRSTPDDATIRADRAYAAALEERLKRKLKPGVLQRLRGLVAKAAPRQPGQGPS